MLPVQVKQLQCVARPPSGSPRWFFSRTSIESRGTSSGIFGTTVVGGRPVAAMYRGRTSEPAVRVHQRTAATRGAIPRVCRERVFRSPEGRHFCRTLSHGQNFPRSHPNTVLMGGRKAISLKIHYFHVLTCPLGRKFHADFKNNLKKFHTISERHKFFD